MAPAKKRKSEKKNLYPSASLTKVPAAAPLITTLRYRGNQRPEPSNGPTASEREIARYVQIIRSAPSVRAEKVAILKEAIRDKTYHVSAKEIADKILAITPEESKF